MAGRFSPKAILVWEVGQKRIIKTYELFGGTIMSMIHFASPSALGWCDWAISAKELLEETKREG
ncbi:MAG: hypothetical protein AB8H12_21665 [Lewinella sp.]